LISATACPDTLGVGTPLPPLFSLRSLDRNQFAAATALVGWRQIEQCRSFNGKNIKSFQENSG
jgi:hypothetical protein